MALAVVEIMFDAVGFQILERTDFTTPLEYAVLGTAPARRVKPEIMPERVSPLRPLKIPAPRARIRLPTAPRRTAPELGSETVDREIDVNELHNALAVLLVSYHRKQQAEGSTA